MNGEEEKAAVDLVVIAVDDTDPSKGENVHNPREAVTTDTSIVSDNPAQLEVARRPLRHGCRTVRPMNQLTRSIVPIPPRIIPLVSLEAERVKVTLKNLTINGWTTGISSSTDVYAARLRSDPPHGSNDIAWLDALRHKIARART